MKPPARTATAKQVDRRARRAPSEHSYLALVSAQGLRTAVIVGRPDLNMPGWRTVNSSHPLSEKEVRDVVAFLLSHRSSTPGQPYSTKSSAGNNGANP